jgi:RNA polymerase sigma factor for flagellar operon FliA
VAAQSYDEERGVPFARYAAIRIRGALLDELRSMDWAARSVRTQAREVDNIKQQLAATLGRTPRPDEVAAALKITVGELDAIQYDVARAKTLSLQGFAPETGPELLADNSAGPEALLLFREKVGYLHQAIEALPERLRYVVVGYFFEQRQMADLGAELGVTESRVSQLRAEALRVLRDGMNSQLEPEAVTPAGRGRGAAGRTAYLQAVAGGGTMATRLARTTPEGEMRPSAGPAPHARTA